MIISPAHVLAAGWYKLIKAFEIDQFYNIFLMVHFERNFSGLICRLYTVICENYLSFHHSHHAIPFSIVFLYSKLLINAIDNVIPVVKIQYMHRQFHSYILKVQTNGETLSLHENPV